MASRSGVRSLTALVLFAAPIHLRAQDPFPPTPANDRFAMFRGPQWLIGDYLMNRNLITRERPILVLCGPAASAFLSPAITKDWVVTKQYVDSIVVDPDCKQPTRHKFGRDRHPLRLYQVVMGQDSLFVVAYAEPFSSSSPPYSHGWMEQYVVPGPGPTGFGRLLIYRFGAHD